MFAERLGAVVTAVEARLAALMAAEAASGAPERLVAAMRHALLAGGKRFRPFLVVETACLLGVSSEAALDAAAALECVHAYSLVHDDLPCMDNDEMRRGAPTVWKAFDEWTAVLAGDALLTLAFQIVAAPRCHPDPAVRADLTLGLARASGAMGMVGGQMLDLEAEKLGQPARPTSQHVARLHAMKTGALIVAAVEAGAILGRADPARQAALVAFARTLGLIFQLADDLLDAEGDAAVVGKAVGKDASAGKATVVGMLGVPAARARLATLVGEAEAALGHFGTDAAVLVEAARFAARRKH